MHTQTTNTSTTTPTDTPTRQPAAVAAVTDALDRARPFALTAVRVALGFLLLMHGLDKFDTGLSNVAGAFDGWGVPLPEVSARFVAGFEVVGGIALIVGVATRLAAVVMTLILLGAIYFAKADMGLLGGWETDLAYIAGLVALVASGPGALSLDRVAGLERP